MSRSGLFRAAALLAAGAAPLMAGSANADVLSAVDGGVPDVGADKLIADATRHVNAIEVGKAVKLPTLSAPVGQHAAQLSIPQERSAPSPLAAPDLGTLPGLPGMETLLGGTHIGDVQAPEPSDLPTNTVLSGILPTING